MGLFDFIKEKEFAEISRLRNQVAALKLEIEEKDKIVRNLQEQIDFIDAKDINEKRQILEQQYLDGLEVYNKLKRETAALSDIVESAEYGIYTPIFNFDDSEIYKLNMQQASKAAAEMVKDGSAVDGGEPLFRKRLQKVILLGFNGVCDNCISNVKWNNIFQMQERINKTFEMVNKAYEDFGFYITNAYKDLRQKELCLAYEYKLKRHREKEEQENIREMLREEEKANREIQAALIKAQAEEQKYLERIEKASNTLSNLQGDKLAKALAQISELETKLSEARENKERAMSMAQQTRRGHVYVISNIGSFGENVYKIGVSRRLDPMERVRELSNASVPFPFDVHAMIYSEDAINLEAALHQEFEDRRVNMRNERKEFFNVTLEEISDVVKRYNANIEFTRIAEARDYRETIALRNTSQELIDTDDNFPIDLFA